MTRKTLAVQRHAKSSWATSGPDFERPLAERGLRDAAAAGRWYVAEDIGFDLVLCSAAARARATLDVVAEQGVEAGRIVVDDRIYHSTSTTLLKLLNGLPEDAARVLLVGHQPTLEDLVVRLSSAPGTRAPEAVDELVANGFRTSAIALLTLDRPWADVADGTARLDAVHVPRG